MRVAYVNCGLSASWGLSFRGEAGPMMKNGRQPRIVAGACRIRMQATPRSGARLPVAHEPKQTYRLILVSKLSRLSIALATARELPSHGDSARVRAAVRNPDADMKPAGSCTSRD
jgi:hypothetical protein